GRRRQLEWLRFARDLPYGPMERRGQCNAAWVRVDLTAGKPITPTRTFCCRGSCTRARARATAPTTGSTTANRSRQSTPKVLARDRGRRLDDGCPVASHTDCANLRRLPRSSTTRWC